MKAKVTTLMTAFNSERYIADAIESVLNQTVSTNELIIIDDGSTDATADIVTRYTGDKRVKLIQQKNKGHAAARNTGLQISSGNLIAFCDSDDLWHPEKLKIQIPELLETLEVGMIHTARTAINSRGEHVGRHHTRDSQSKTIIEDATRRLFQQNYICGSSALIRRECFDRVGFFDESFKLSSDHEFYLRLSMHYRFGFLNQELYLYRKHEGQATGNRELREQYKEKVVEHFLSLYPDAISRDDINTAYVNIYKSRGHVLLKQDKKPAEARKAFLKALAYRPLNPSVWFRILRSYFV